MKHLKVAGRYAKALLDLAVEKNELEATYKDVLHVKDTLKAAGDLRAVLHSPVITADKKESILDAVFKGQIGLLTAHFCALVVRHGREANLAEILERFVVQYRQHQNIVVAQITTASDLSEATLDKLRGLVSINQGQRVELRTEVKPEIIGGFVVRVGDRQADASVAGKLRAIRRSFKENPYQPKL
jgi:F-type H+-transporting ATPase subunit delta